MTKREHIKKSRGDDLGKVRKRRTHISEEESLALWFSREPTYGSAWAGWDQKEKGEGSTQLEERHHVLPARERKEADLHGPRRRE